MHSDVRYIGLMLCAMLVCSWGVRRGQQQLSITPFQKFCLGLGGFIGAMLGAKLPYALLDPQGPWVDAAWLSDGKTILCGLVGGYLGVETAKFLTNVHVKTGDTYAVPVACAIAIGRLGCFVGGCCFGRPTTLPWGVIFPSAGDALPRHPTQIYEAAFHGLLAVFLAWCGYKNLFPRQRFKLYILLYLAYRFFSEWLRPEPLVGYGLTAYQWGALALFPVFIALWVIDAPSPTGAQQPDNHPRQP